MKRVWLFAFRPDSETSSVLAPCGTVTKWEVVLLRCTEPWAVYV